MPDTMVGAEVTSPCIGSLNGLQRILDTLMLRAQAAFTAENSLVLTGVSESAQFTTTGGRSGIYPTSFFTNTASGSQFVSSSGQWLAEPQVPISSSPWPSLRITHVGASQVLLWAR